MSLHDHTEKHEAVVTQVKAELEALGYRVVHARRTGSAYYGKEHPGDFDVLAYVRVKSNIVNRFLSDAADVEAVTKALVSTGYQDCRYVSQPGELGYEGSDYGETWAAVRRQDVNIILTNCHEWYIRAAAATELTRATAVTDGEVPKKEDTVEVFRICRFQED